MLVMTFINVCDMVYGNTFLYVKSNIKLAINVSNKNLGWAYSFGVRFWVYGCNWFICLIERDILGDAQG